MVGLPEGTDPAELAEREGGEAVSKLISESKPFVVFNVDRILERADTRSAEGRDRALEELRPVLGEVPPSILRDELIRRVAGRLALTAGRLTSLLEDGVTTTGAPGGARASGPGLARAERPGPVAVQVGDRRGRTPARAPSGCSWPSASRCPSTGRSRWRPSRSASC